MVPPLMQAQTDAVGSTEDYAKQHQEELIELYFSSTLNAKNLCTLMFSFWHSGHESARSYALRPGAPTGHYQRKLDTAFGFEQNDK